MDVSGAEVSEMLAIPYSSKAILNSRYFTCLRACNLKFDVCHDSDRDSDSKVWMV